MRGLCTLGAIDGKFLFKNRDMDLGAGIAEDVMQGHGRLRFIGIAGHASPRERGLNSGINEAGVAAAMTFADVELLMEVLKTRMPRGVLIEEILRNARDLEAALRITGDFLHTTPLVGGNIVIMTPAGGAVVEQLYPRYAVEMIKQPVTVRTNHFLNLTVPGKLAVNERNSRNRFDKCGSLLTEVAESGNADEHFNAEVIGRVLSNHEGRHPICRHGGRAVTVSAVIYDIRNRVMHYTHEQPCQGNFVHYTL